MVDNIGSDRTMMGSTLLIPEVFALFNKADSKKKKIKVLQENNSKTLRDIIRATFDAKIKFLVPKVDNLAEIPGFTPDPGALGSSPSSLFQESRKFYYFCEGGDPNLKQPRREELYIQILESIHPTEAEIIINMVNGNLKVPGLTQKLALDAFPGLFSTEDKNVAEAPDTEEDIVLVCLFGLLELSKGNADNSRYAQQAIQKYKEMKGRLNE